MATRIAPSADVSEEAVLGEGTSIWHLAQVREHAVLGRDCIVGRGAYIGEGARLGDNCKVQNYALVYEPAHLGEDVGCTASVPRVRRRPGGPGGLRSSAGDFFLSVFSAASLRRGGGDVVSRGSVP